MIPGVPAVHLDRGFDPPPASAVHRLDRDIAYVRAVRLRVRTRNGDRGSWMAMPTGEKRETVRCRQRESGETARAGERAWGETARAGVTARPGRREGERNSARAGRPAIRVWRSAQQHSQIMEPAPAPPADHDVNFMIDAILGGSLSEGHGRVTPCTGRSSGTFLRGCSGHGRRRPRRGSSG
jgi:hypothetical protein